MQLFKPVTNRFCSKAVRKQFNCCCVHHSFTNRLRLRKNYDCLHKINNCNISGVLYWFMQALWFGCLCVCWRNKQSRRSRLLKFWLEQMKHFLVFLSIAYVVGCCFLVEWGIKRPIWMLSRIHREWYLCNYCGSVSCVFGGEQVVKVKKTSEFLT